MSVRFEYATMFAAEVFEITSVSFQEPGMYLSEDKSLRQYRELIEKGFKWVRTDGDRAVFERSYLAEP